MNTNTKVQAVYITTADELKSVGIAVPESVKMVPVWEPSEGTMAYWVGGDEVIEVVDQDFWPRPLLSLEGDVLNLTPHTIGVLMADGTIEHVRPSGMQARAIEEVVDSPVTLNRVASIVSKTYGATTGPYLRWAYRC